MSAIVTPLLWSFLPSQLSHFLLPHLSSNLPAIFPPAPRNSPAYARNYRLVFTGIIVLWLLWTFARESSANGQGHLVEDWYALLGVSRDVDDDGLKKAFRTLSRRYHPDRAGPGQEDTFILVRKAYETLLDPVKRYAYDRFGPDILTWTKTASLREYMLAGLMRSSGFYIASTAVMLLLAVTGRARQGAYWRNVLLAVLLLSELSLVLYTSRPRRFAAYLPRGITAQPQFLQIRLMHRIFTSLSVGISQLAGVWGPDSHQDRDQDQDEADERAWDALYSLIKGVEMEAVGQFQHEVVPILMGSRVDPRTTERRIWHEMEQVLLDRSISSHPDIRDAWKAAVARSHTTQRTTLRTRNPVVPLQSSLMDLEQARRIPLPPSPPPTPPPKLLDLPE